MAPETIDTSREKGGAVDWWAIGCIVYEFITGVPPFNATSVEEVWDNISNRRIDWPKIGREDDCMSPEAKDLIESLLEMDPTKRLARLEDAKHHPFFKGRGHSSGINWENIRSSQPPMVPKLNRVGFSKEKRVALSQIFESTNPELKPVAKLAHKFKRTQMQGIRHELLHEENLNYICDIA